MKKGSRQNLADQVRQRIIQSGVSQRQIARDTGIKQPGLSKFLSGGSLKIETLDLLLEYLHVGLSESPGTDLGGNSIVRETKRRYGEDSISFGSELEGLEGKTFSTILIDPPWRFQNRTGKMAPEHRRLNRYETMELEDIKRMPVSAHCKKPCHLYMWCPNALRRKGSK